MTDYGKSGKPNTGFPLFPQSLEIAARFPHSHSRGDDSLIAISKNKPRKEALTEYCSASAVQAHSSMRKCYERGVS